MNSQTPTGNSKATILIVEDDEEIAALIARYLVREGYEVERAINGEEGLELYANGLHDVVVLDLGLPGMDGLALLPRLSQAGNCRVIILSARKEEADKLAGLGLGADDYLTKPFSMAELAARVRAQIRRRRESLAPRGLDEARIYRLRDIELDPRRLELRRAGKAIKLTHIEFTIMRLLIGEPGRVFTKTQIIDAAWGSSYVAEEGSLMTHMSNLRKKLGDDSASPRYIENVWGVGYRIIEDLAEGHGH